MSAPVTLRYHQATFDLLGAEPVVSADALRQIEECERRCRAHLPESLREWYTLEGVTHPSMPSVLGHPVFLPRLLREFAALQNLPRRSSPVCLGIDYRHYVSLYHVSLKAGPDPPVTDAQGKRQVSPSFSRFIRECVWDRLLGQSPLSVLFAHKEVAFGPVALDFLVEHFKEVPRDGPPVGAGEDAANAPNSRQFRFHRPSARVYVTALGEPEVGECRVCWKLAADSEGDLMELLRQVGGFIGSLATYSVNGPRARAVMDGLRERGGKASLRRVGRREEP
jgi:hypothetical protein